MKYEINVNNRNSYKLKIDNEFVITLSNSRDTVMGDVKRHLSSINKLCEEKCDMCDAIALKITKKIQGGVTQ